MGLSRTVSETDGDFSRKSQYFPSLVLCVPFELGTGAGSQKTGMIGLPGRQRNFDDIFSVVDIIRQRDTDRQTDRQTPRDSKDRAYTHSVAR